MTEHNMTKQFAKDFRKNLAKYEKSLIEISTDKATDALRNTDWSSSLLDIIKDELHHYEGVVHDNPDNPEPELAERKFLARLTEYAAGTAGMYSLPIDSQLDELTDYLQNSIMDKTDIDVEHVKELLEL